MRAERRRMAQPVPGPRVLLPLALAALLLMPASLAAPNVPLPRIPMPCGGDPTCGIVEDLEPIVDSTAETVRVLSNIFLPAGSGTMTLVGTGQMLVTRGGATKACDTSSWIAVDVSDKPLGFDPTGNLAYGGAQGQGALAYPCAAGHAAQPLKREMSGSADGAWTASRDLEEIGWQLAVSGPLPGGFRDVWFRYWWDNGDYDVFAGRLREYR